MISAIVMSVIVGAMGAVTLMAIEDHLPAKGLGELLCKANRHRFKSGIIVKKNKYFCQRCRVPRQNPNLRVVEGGKKEFGSFLF